MFPVVIYDKNVELPDANIFYLITKNGILLYKDLKTIRSLVKVNSISCLQEFEGKEFAELKITTIPKEIIAQAVAFFKYVYEINKSEAGLIIHYFYKTGGYELYCPKQTVSQGSVKWSNKDEPIPKDAVRIGSIHSHASGSAFHSTTDKEDEKCFDGIHITIGHIDMDKQSFVASIVVNGNRFKLDEESSLEYLEMNIIKKDNLIDNTKDNLENQFKSPIFEDYQPIISNHNVKDVTVFDDYLHNKWSKWSFSTDERNFTLDIDNNDYVFPDEWKDKFTHVVPKLYKWEDGKLITKDWSKYNKWEKSEYSNCKFPITQYYGPKNSGSINCSLCKYKRAIELLGLEDYADEKDIVTSSLKDNDFLNDEYPNDYNPNEYTILFDEYGNMIDEYGNEIDEVKSIEEVLKGEEFID